jgi:ribosome recycling factor
MSINTDFSIYPNPSNVGYVNISSTESETIQVNVYDILGKQVINAAVASGRLDISTLNTGVYIVKLTQGSATTTKKLIVQ